MLAQVYYRGLAKWQHLAEQEVIFKTYHVLSGAIYGPKKRQ